MHRLFVAGLLLVGCGTSDDKGKPNPADTGTPQTVTGTPSVGTVDCPDTGTSELSTSTGCYIGRATAGVEAFLGIRYAEPPLGDLRWARPQPIAPALEPVPADRIGSPCLQTNGTVDLELAPGEGSEDCLFLNVIRPDGASPGDELPILFFIHGGGHIDGHGGAGYALGQSFFQPPETPPALAQVPDLVQVEDVILVTFNYRLAQLGWLAMPGLSDESGDGGSGNQGLWDTLLALQWVNDNAEALGGDPNNILMFGESAGSVSACTLLASPLAEGMFHKVMMQSGVCTYVTQELDDAPFFGESAFEQGLRLAQALSCDGAGDGAAILSCLREKSATEVMAVMQGQFGSLDTGAEAYNPVVDGVLVPTPVDERMANGQIADVPVVIGVNRDEGTLFTVLAPLLGEQAFDLILSTTALVLQWDAGQLQAMYDPTKRYGGDLGDAYAAFYGDLVFVWPSRSLADTLSQHTEVRTYWWTHGVPLLKFLDLGAFHGSELAFAFGTSLDLGDDAIVQDLTHEAWGNIARGTWEVDGQTWPLFGSSSDNGGRWMELGLSPGVMKEGPRKEQLDWMDSQ